MAHQKISKISQKNEELEQKSYCNPVRLTISPTQRAILNGRVNKWHAKGDEGLFGKVSRIAARVLRAIADAKPEFDASLGKYKNQFYDSLERFLLFF